MMVSISRKKVVNKIILFPLDIILIPPARMKDSLKMYVSTTPESCFHLQEYLKNMQKLASNSRREVTLQKWLHLNLNDGFN